MSNIAKNIMFIESLAEALGSSDGQSIEEINEDLESAGIDIKSTLNSLLKSVEDISMKVKRQKLEIAKKDRLQNEIIRTSIKDQFIDWTREQIIERIKENINSLGEVSLAYRELESQPMANIKSLLEDLEIARKSKRKK